MKANERSPQPPTYSRRAAIGLGAAALAGTALGAEATAVDAAPSGRATAAPADLLGALQPEIAPRSAWGADRPVTGPIVPEDDVRFLLVHHTASTNDYQPAEVAEQIRGFHQFHTGPEKGWPDVAYNFFVDRFGGIWEARQGSIAGPVRGDATGGSQGFALLCCLIGDHSTEPVTDEARTSMVALLAWLAERHGIDTEPGATVDFVSRGSNRWPVGADVTAATISGHRDMSQTSCPGDFGYDLVTLDLPRAVSDRRVETAAALATTPSVSLVEQETTTTAPPATTSPPTTGPAPAEQAGVEPGAVDDNGLPIPDEAVGPVLAAGGAAAALAALTAARRRRPAD